MTDIQLIAETMDPERKLDWLWKRCYCKQLHCRGYAKYKFILNPNCSTCQGTGRIPYIDDTNILRVIFRWAKHQSWWLVERDKAGPVQSNIETMFSDLCSEWPDWNESSFVDYCVRLIAAAIREQGAGE